MEQNITAQEEALERGCGTGIQTRQVYCSKADNGHVVSGRCPESTRPDEVRSCTLPCKVDCIISPFSEWSLCPTSCSTVNTTISTQSRHRIIIQRAANGGQECPATLFEERECNLPPLCPTYRWQTHRWHPCILVPDSVRQSVGSQTEACGFGLETRDLGGGVVHNVGRGEWCTMLAGTNGAQAVTCVGVDDAPADVAECVKWAGVMPTAVRQCRVACRDDCTFSSWSKFSHCQGCGGWRTRTRSLIGRSKKRWRCQREALVEREACLCSEFHLRVHGSWSPCLLPQQHHQAGFTLTRRGYHQNHQGWRTEKEGKECGQGWRYRAQACLDHQGELVDSTHCNSSGCSATHHMLVSQVSEVVPCYSECNQYVWEAEPWGVCIIDPPNIVNNSQAPQPLCGEGVQTRQVRCMEKLDEKWSSVDFSECDQEEQPVTAQACLLPCPGHCVTSEWSQWSECLAGCNERELMWRSRTVLRMPGSGHTCPQLNQTLSCANTTCLSYSYAYSDWSSCRLSDNAVCGQGTKTRLLNCVRSDGKLVELNKCKEWGPSRGKLSAPCEVSCPVDCLLSDWSLWSECSHTCGAQSQMTRSRLVLQQAGEGGRPCPSQLSQSKPCPIRPCYSWRLAEWTSCRVEGAECGEGVRERNLSCVMHWGSISGPPLPKAVHEDRCMESRLSKVIGTELWQPCSIPCPGDCHLTEWSAWSACQLLCLDGRSFETSGRQARSRAVIMQVPESKDSCPSQVYETRPCQGGTCFSYEWVTGGWRNNQRAVWCQRSDGVNVTGGCFLQNKPSTVRHCHPPCAKPFSFCTQSGVCGCERGFTEVMTSHGFLDYCTRTPGPDYKKADVKTRPSHVHHKNRPREWALQPLGPDGRVRPWVYGLMAAGFIMTLLIIAMSFLLCKNLKGSPNTGSTQKALALAYDGDADM
ncbi:hypothetical protein NFI96_017260 [Prochilodus magdalenae]|nr:hypothetical protein NFI96_017260 [Prochilodus magdalenae]